MTSSDIFSQLSSPEFGNTINETSDEELNKFMEIAIDLTISHMPGSNRDELANNLKSLISNIKKDVQNNCNDTLLNFRETVEEVMHDDPDAVIDGLTVAAHYSLEKAEEQVENGSINEGELLEKAACLQNTLNVANEYRNPFSRTSFSRIMRGFVQEPVQELFYIEEPVQEPRRRRRRRRVKRKRTRQTSQTN